MGMEDSGLGSPYYTKRVQGGFNDMGKDATGEFYDWCGSNRSDSEPWLIT